MEVSGSISVKQLGLVERIPSRHDCQSKYKQRVRTYQPALVPPGQQVSSLCQPAGVTCNACPKVFGFTACTLTGKVLEN